MANYLKFVFSDNISIERSDNEVVPKFFTFMSTDENGSNAYFHCFIFYEQFNMDDIKYDFDPEAASHRFERQRDGTENNLSASMQQSIHGPSIGFFTAKGMEKTQEAFDFSQVKLFSRGNTIM